MKVPLLDLVAQYETLRAEMEPAIREVFESQYFILGPSVSSCEEAIANYCGLPYACGVSSGTDALLISLMAEGIGPGDEVITSPYTFFATAGCIARVGATPIFVDIDPVAFNLVPELVSAAVTDKTRAIMPVHLYGQMADMPAIMKIADTHDLVVIEDAAQAIGATCQGKAPGCFGHYACFSFFPSKNLGGAGDGGMVVTSDDVRAAHLSSLRNHGMNPKYYHPDIGGNFRLDALQAAVVKVKLNYLDQWAESRRSNARRYDHLFKEAGLAGERVQLPAHPHGEGSVLSDVENRHVFNQYIIRAPKRDELRAHLTAAHVGCEVYYPLPLHLQECFSRLGYGKGSLPESERAADETLALPIYPELTDDQAEYVVNSIKGFLHP